MSILATHFHNAALTICPQGIFNYRTRRWKLDRLALSSGSRICSCCKSLMAAGRRRGGCRHEFLGQCSIPDPEQPWVRRPRLRSSRSRLLDQPGIEVACAFDHVRMLGYGIRQTANGRRQLPSQIPRISQPGKGIGETFQGELISRQTAPSRPNGISFGPEDINVNINGSSLSLEASEKVLLTVWCDKKTVFSSIGTFFGRRCFLILAASRNLHQSYPGFHLRARWGLFDVHFNQYGNCVVHATVKEKEIRLSGRLIN